MRGHGFDSFLVLYFFPNFFIGFIDEGIGFNRDTVFISINDFLNFKMLFRLSWEYFLSVFIDKFHEKGYKGVKINFREFFEHHFHEPIVVGVKSQLFMIDELLHD